MVESHLVGLRKGGLGHSPPPTAVTHTPSSYRPESSQLEAVTVYTYTYTTYSYLPYLTTVYTVSLLSLYSMYYVYCIYVIYNCTVYIREL
jgi:hypothetical protein